MKIEKLENSEVKFEILKEGEELKKIKKEVLSKFKDVKVDGFRKGHVPEDVILKNFEKEIRDELLNFVLREAYEKMLEDGSFKQASDFMITKFEYNKDKLDLEVKVAIVPEFEMPKYKGLNIEKKEASVNDEEVTLELDRLVNQYKNFEKSDKEVAELGDVAVIDFEGFVDGVAFENGKSENYKLELGSKSFIDTFEEQIVGHKVGEEFEINVNFPEEYHSENLKGKPAMFKIKLNAIEVLNKPELNDDFAKKVGSESIEELKNNIKGRLLSNKEASLERERLNEIVEKIALEVEFPISEILVHNEIHRQIDAFSNQLRMQGATLEDYLKMTNNSIEKMHEDLREGATKAVKISFLLSRIIELENIKVEESEINEELSKRAAMYGMTLEQLNKELGSQEAVYNFQAQVENNLMATKINKFLMENN